MDYEKLVLDTLLNSKKALKVSEICKLSGLDKNNVDKALKSLKVSGKIVSPQRCFWQSKMNK